MLTRLFYMYVSIGYFDDPFHIQFQGFFTRLSRQRGGEPIICTSLYDWSCGIWIGFHVFVRWHLPQGRVIDNCFSNLIVGNLSAQGFDGEEWCLTLCYHHSAFCDAQ
ncbi:hypothetical protein M758_6G161600 [Ceratodon purpureus]|uniref:Uncharacterized protein n=1 Tax=Ceratodon purpureus TaxID=3225 RepID=A0A8T0HII3_CERPU|nr:hypothetical protein KC19_6G168000 [Ceratodon purpureus]KAG0614241.1 hypothetical protein M758_6G161600 [Ceratodon purpureus]